MELADALRNNYPVSDATIEKLLAAVEILPVKKNEAIVEQGKRTGYFYWIRTGLFCVDYHNDGKEDTICFGLDGDPFTSMYSLMRNEPAQFSCIALTSAEVYRISYDEFNRLMDENHDLAFWMRNVLIEQVYAFERRYVYLGTYDAYARYEQFIKMRPELFTRIPLKYLAQYLKITPQTLSRIRKEYSRH